MSGNDGMTKIEWLGGTERERERDRECDGLIRKKEAS